MTSATSLVAVVCVLTFVHFAAAQMRGPLVPLYAVAHGATPTGVGFIVAAHMAVAALASIPLGRASDVWGRRSLLLGGMATSAVTSLLLPLVESELALTLIYGLAGLGVAAFTPSAMSLVGDAAAPGAAGRAYAWYATAHYGAIGVGPFLGGLAAEWWGYHAAFVVSAAGAAIAFGLGVAMAVRPAPQPDSRTGAAFRDIRANPRIWAGWLVAASGLLTQGVVFTFFPLLAETRALSPAAIGFVFLVLGLANTGARIPAGWLMDRTKRSAPYAVGGVLAGSVATALLPHVTDRGALLALVAVFGVVSGTAGVAVGVALGAATTPAGRGLVMGGYSTALYFGLALGSFAVGPVITRYGYDVGFAIGGAAGALGAVVAGVLWAQRQARCTDRDAGDPACAAVGQRRPATMNTGPRWRINAAHEARGQWGSQLLDLPVAGRSIVALRSEEEASLWPKPSPSAKSPKQRAWPRGPFATTKRSGCCRRRAGRYQAIDSTMSRACSGCGSFVGHAR